MTALLSLNALLESPNALLEYLALELTALLEYLDLLQFSFHSFNVFFTEAVTLVVSIVAMPLQASVNDIKKPKNSRTCLTGY